MVRQPWPQLCILAVSWCAVALGLRQAADLPDEADGATSGYLWGPAHGKCSGFSIGNFGLASTGGGQCDGSPTHKARIWMEAAGASTT